MPEVSRSLSWLYYVYMFKLPGLYPDDEFIYISAVSLDLNKWIATKLIVVYKHILFNWLDIDYTCIVFEALT